METAVLSRALLGGIQELVVMLNNQPSTTLESI